MAKMRIANVRPLDAFFDDWHQPHNEWREYRGHPAYSENSVSGWGWNPHHGESHVAYSVNHDDLNGTWGVTHHGFYRGTKIVHPEEATGYLSEPTETPDFFLDHDGTPDRVGPNDVSTKGTWKISPYRSFGEARAAAEEHFERNYRSRAKPSADDYDLDSFMRDHDPGIDEPEDGYDIFGDRS
jgi:hypothetical protein